MSNRYGPRIVTDGLVLCLDAADRNSYPGTGTTWTDLSGNGNNGTLTNGPTFSSSNKGNIAFDGTNDVITLPSISRTGANNSTQIIWFKWSGVNQNILLCYLGSNTGANGLGLFIGTGGCAASNICGIFLGGISCNRSQDQGSAYTLTTNWTMFTLTRDTQYNYFYVNDSLVSTVNYPPNGNTSTLSVSFGEPIGGNVSSIMFYNKFFSSADVAQNYNAIKGRFNP